MVSPFMVTLCIECSQQLSSLPKYSDKLVLTLTSKHSESYSCAFGMASSRTAALSHRPNVFMVESSIPTDAAVVSTLIRKLWPAYLDWSRPAAVRAFRTSRTNLSLVSQAEKGAWLSAHGWPHMPALPQLGTSGH